MSKLSQETRPAQAPLATWPFVVVISLAGAAVTILGTRKALAD
ncbi:hypothetical protein ACFL1X_14740 [Candidatus Hydrogenedentota bacterium]